MRLSVDRNDPGFEEAQVKGINTSYSLVFVDGKRPQWCVTADTDLGVAVIKYYKVDVDEQGKFVIESKSCVMETVHGRVEIKLIRDPNGKWPHPGVPEDDQPGMKTRDV